MTIYSGIFNSVNGDRKYNAWWFAKYFATFIGNGVFPNPSSNLQVAAYQNMKVVVKPGSGWIDGYFIYSDGDHVLSLDVADGVLKRIDRVVMRLNHLTRKIEIVVKKGTFASSPVAPTLQRDTDAYELALADVLINNGATQITQANITDQRLNSTVCGIVHGTVNQVDTTTIFNQYQAWFNDVKGSVAGELDIWQDAQEQEFLTWFESVKDILDGDVAGNLASRIAVLEQQMIQMNNHVADYVKHAGSGVTTRTSNNYSVTLDPAPTAYVDLMSIVFKATADVNGAIVTMNVNGLGNRGILKPNGSNQITLKNGSVYTIRYSGSAFTLQGEGGEYGNAKEGDVVQGVTFGTEQGVKTGTLVAYKTGAISSSKVKEKFSQKWVKNSVNSQGRPFGIDRFGNIYIGYNYLSQANGRLIKYNKSGQIVKSFTPSTQYGTILGVDVGGDRVAAVCDDRFTYILDLDLNLIASIPAGTYFSTHVAVDSLGNTYIQWSDTFEVRSVRKYNSSGTQVGVAQLTNNFRTMQLMATADNQLAILTSDSPVASILKFTFSSYIATQSWTATIDTAQYGSLYQARVLNNGNIALATSGTTVSQRRDGPWVVIYDTSGTRISSVSFGWTNYGYENHSYRWSARFCLCPDGENGSITSVGAISYISLSDDTKVSIATEVVRRLRSNLSLEHVGIATSGESSIFAVAWMNYSLEDDLIYYHDTSGSVRCYKKEYTLI
ncbi:hypothetical protein J1907_03095 [Lysinibacillus sphaericus]|uniref:hypothetical protein n=1 Tax=Lysinibacillus sphaericus TaxID=1421 RepID=UPI00068AA108|nr:hypothetical protein [Lysinibacillus sphaericus]QTB23116.1 hypothetical protein J1907_03095 [Lysinibacillus sphaericus]